MNLQLPVDFSIEINVVELSDYKKMYEFTVTVAVNGRYYTATSTSTESIGDACDKAYNLIRYTFLE